MGRHSCCVKQKLRKGLWSPEEDEKLFKYISRFGVGCWSSVPKLAGLQRCGKSCRLRWINYLRPDLKRGMFSQQEEDLIISLHQMLGNRWAQIAAQLPGRTDNEIKNFWNSCLKKKLIKQGIDPTTHKPITSQLEVKEEKIKNQDKTSALPIISNFSLQEPTFLIDNSSYYTNTGLNDPLFGFEFQAGTVNVNHEQSILDHQNSDLASLYNTSNFSGFASMPSLSSFDFSENSSSRMSSSCSNSSINNKNSSMGNYNYQNIVENSTGLMFNVDNHNMFEFAASGLIKTEEDLKPIIMSNPWEDHQNSDFNNYSIKSLSEDLTGADFDVFHQI